MSREHPPAPTTDEEGNLVPPAPEPCFNCGTPLTLPEVSARYKGRVSCRACEPLLFRDTVLPETDEEEGVKYRSRPVRVARITRDRMPYAVQRGGSEFDLYEE